MTHSTLTATCHCGAVQVQIARAPDYLNECNCSLCDSHGVWWGYFDPPDVTVTGETKVYQRIDRDDPAVSLHFCGTCGCTTHWTLLPVFLEKVARSNSSESGNRFRDSEMRPQTDLVKCGVNMRLFARQALVGIELRFPDGRGWDGIGQWGFVREAVVL